MKKRLRKKLHKGEFQQFGISLMVPVNAENVETTLDTITAIADQHKILFCGGGLSRFVLPSKEYGDLDIPSKIEFLIMNIALGPETLMDCIVGYFVNPFGKEIDADTADKVKAALENALKVEFKINCRIDLWN
jgi:hypothetical protein